jgi:uncharacterized protein
VNALSRKGTFEFLDGIRCSTRPVLSLALTAYAIMLFICVLISQAGFGRSIAPIQRETHGFVSMQLVLPLLALAPVACVVFGICKLRCSDIGWNVRSILPAVAVTAMFWLASQIAFVVAPPDLNDAGDVEQIADGPVAAALAPLFAQLLGNALVEETVFRGIVLPQIYLKSAKFCPRLVALVIALIGSLMAFTLSHAPVMLDGHFATWAELFHALLWTIPFGLVLSITFVVTQNLFVSVGLHALWNSPALIAPAKYQQIEHVWWVLSVALIAGWWTWRKVRGKPKLP